MFKKIVAASIAAVVFAGAAQAVPLSGVFDVVAINVTNASRAQSQATFGNYVDAINGVDTSPNTTSTFETHIFNYDGILDFDTRGEPFSPLTTISQFLSTGTGTLIGMDNTFGSLRNSQGNIDDATATTTFYFFSLKTATPYDLTITHDDGVAVFNNGDLLGGLVGPNAVQPEPTLVNGSVAGDLSFLYVSTNSDPSVFIVDAAEVAPVPLPAGAVLLLGALGGLAVVRHRKRPA
ncbi:VPLPA-CTERM sorting domain-containing protein [Jannaschia sp. CCS1]|uniref:VPLPA-CTERM sorting domain-containing protein n=1 Tax=Jannaschia sp. (strain CCS1) TaxID=290400 RepID=UPI000053C7F1|nr:VPLPA-CTERM sorting domain-containing protein [Jannaschia sp. CCS1]ABD53713.1 hypothetical protein Jann_0796 [Jannaschia sp. CCS1]